MSGMPPETAKPSPILAGNLRALGRIRHGFFTRAGGVSEGIYAGLNVGLGSNDDRDRVLENRRRVATALGHDGSQISTPFQIHSADALVIDAPLKDPPPKCDALVTAKSGVVIGVLAADCTPVLFADAEAGIIGAAHAGWRGALGGVLEATVARMVECGAVRDRITCAIGPTISQSAYEVGPEFEAEFVSQNPDFKEFFKVTAAGERPFFDLPGFVRSRLKASGLSEIEDVAICTYENESELFSYRRTTHRQEVDYGRQISAIVLI